MIGKQKRLIIIFTAVIAVLLLGYFVIVLPIVNREEPVETTAPIETEAGEAIGLNDRRLLFPHTVKSEMQSIEVYNEFGYYKFFRDENDNFQIDGYEGTPINPELFSQLVVDCGYTLSKAVVIENASDEKIAEYELDEASNPAKYVLTTLDGVKHTVYVGAPILTGGGYYCMYEGRRTVYVLGTTLGTTILAHIEDFVTPLLTYGIDSNDYFMIDKFMLLRGEDPFIAVRVLDEDEKFREESLVEHRLTYPAPYTPSSSTYYDVLMKIAALQGDFTAQLGITEEAIEKYGLDDPAYSLYFAYKGIEYTLFISALQEDGYYYVISPLFDLIAGVSPTTLEFLTWELVKWLDLPLFQVNINKVSEITITTPKISTTFYLEGEGENLIVRAGSPNGEIIDTENFRKLYIVLLTVSIENYTPLTEAETETILTDKNLQLEFKVTTRSGTTTTYQFYPYSTRRSFAVVNGSGEFYVLRDVIQKLENDTKRALNNEPIDSYGKS